jgi:hypothetical protein
MHRQCYLTLAVVHPHLTNNTVSQQKKHFSMLMQKTDWKKYFGTTIGICCRRSSLSFLFGCEMNVSCDYDVCVVATYAAQIKSGL